MYRQSSIRRTQPVYSVYSALSFERSTADSAFRHTLEPSLFYLNVPHRAQDDIPLFDTTANEFNFQSLFYENRFNGVDRIGDADQLTMALTSRLLHRNSGKEALRASVGRIYYFRNREVQLNAAAQPNDMTQPDTAAQSNIIPTDRRSRSPWASELNLNLNNKVKFLASWVWDSEDEQTLKLTTGVSLKARSNRVINLYYRSQASAFERQLPFESSSSFEQAGINLGMSLDERWTLLSGWAYDFDADDSLSAFVGLEYQSCCWAFSFNIQRRIIDVNNPTGRLADGGFEYENFIGFEFRLEGLGDLGNNSQRRLARRVFGYD